MGLVFVSGAKDAPPLRISPTSKETRETEPDLYKICTRIIAYNYFYCNTLTAAARKVFLDFLKRFLAYYVLYAAGVGLRRLVLDAEHFG